MKTKQLATRLRETAAPADVSALDAYWGVVSNLDKAKALKIIQACENKIARIMNAAMRSARRHEDAGPMDIAHERCEPMQVRLELLQWWLKNPKKAPPKELLERLKYVLEHKQSTMEYKQEKKEAFNKYPNIVGKTITWKSKYGDDKEGTVLKQLPGRWGGGPRYKVRTEEGVWTVPHELVKKFITPKNLDKVLKGLDKDKEKKQQALQSFKAGDIVAWNSKRAHAVMKGKVVKVGRARISALVEGGGVWRIPLSLIISVNGKKLKL